MAREPGDSAKAPSWLAAQSGTVWGILPKQSSRQGGTRERKDQDNSQRLGRHRVELEEGFQGQTHGSGDEQVVLSGEDPRRGVQDLGLALFPGESPAACLVLSFNHRL
jgi:hypothetical protein